MISENTVLPGFEHLSPFPVSLCCRFCCNFVAFFNAFSLTNLHTSLIANRRLLHATMLQYWTFELLTVLTRKISVKMSSFVYYSLFKTSIIIEEIKMTMSQKHKLSTNNKSVILNDLR